MDEDNETYSHVVQAGTRLRHAHTADRERRAPGFSAQSETRFTEFFRASRTNGYTQRDDARITIEASNFDFRTQTAPALALLRKRFEESAL